MSYYTQCVLLLDDTPGARVYAILFMTRFLPALSLVFKFSSSVLSETAALLSFPACWFQEYRHCSAERSSSRAAKTFWTHGSCKAGVSAPSLDRLVISSLTVLAEDEISSLQLLRVESPSFPGKKNYSSKKWHCNSYSQQVFFSFKMIFSYTYHIGV